MKLGHTVQLWPEGEQYVAHAVLLDVASSGSTPAKARKALKEAVTLEAILDGMEGRSP